MSYFIAGASMCAGGVEGACDVRHYPEYFWLVIAGFVITLALFMVAVSYYVLKKSKVKRNITLGRKYALIFAGFTLLWITLGAAFLVYSIPNIETEQQRTDERKRECEQRGGLCEY